MMDNWSSLLRDLAEAFSGFPALALIGTLVAWIAACWIYKFAVMSRSLRFYEILLSPFKLPFVSETGLLGLAKTQLLVVGSSSSDYKWNLEDVFLGYWALRAKRVAVQYLTVVIVLSAVFVAIMYAAQPRTDVSLARVTGLLAYASLIGSLTLAILSVGVMLGSTHKIPADFVTKQRGIWIILLAF